MSDNLTLVLQSWKKRRRNYRVLFGNPYKTIRLDWRRSVTAFNANQIFGYERWDANKFGTQFWAIDILISAVGDKRICRIPGIKPGAVSLSQVQGKASCKAILSVLDTLKSDGLLSTISVAQWRLIGHEIQSGRSAKDMTKKLGKSR